MSKSVKDITFHAISEILPSSDQNEVIKIWTDLAGLSETEAKRRLSELILLTKNGHGAIIGISTAVKTLVPQLQNNLYVYRCFILAQFRAPGLDTMMIVKSKELLFEKSKNDKEKPCVGIMVIVQNEQIQEHWRQAVWPVADMIYMGNTTQGHHMRVGYFKGVKI